MNLDQDDKEKIKKVLIAFYGSSAEQIKINDMVYIEIVKMLQSSKLCTHMMHFVPRPILTGNPIKWLEKSIRKPVLKFITSKENEHYLICIKVLALARKTTIHMASQNLLQQ